MDKKDKEYTAPDIIQSIQTKLKELQGSVKLLAQKPRPIILICLSEITRERSKKLHRVFFKEIYKLFKLTKDNFVPGFRSVDIDRLEYVLEHGCDVNPTDSVMYVGVLDKALEYGGSSKVVQAFDFNQLKQSFVEVDANTTDRDLEKLKLKYSTVQYSIDGKKIWLSRLTENAPQRATDYEIAYGKFIPGNPIDALLGLIIIVDSNLDITSLESQIKGSTKIQWTL